MKISRISMTLAMVLAAALLIAASARPASAQAQGQVTVAICNPATIANQSQELKDSQEQLQADQAADNKTLQDKQQTLDGMRDVLKLLAHDSPQYADKRDAYEQQLAEMNLLKQQMEIKLARKENQRLMKLFNKILAKTAEVAKQQGISLVIMDRHEDIPDEALDTIKPEKLQELLLERTVLYCDVKLDITQTVLVALNKDYNKTAP